MKKVSFINLVVACALIILANGCTKKFSSINENPNAATVVPATNVLARGIINSASTLFGERLAIYYTGFKRQRCSIQIGIAFILC